MVLQIDIHVATLSETWLCDSGSIKEDSYTLFWCGYPESDRPMHGCGIAVKNYLFPTTDQPTFISPRLMKTRFLLKSGYISIISAYVPTLGADDETKDSFYQHLSSVVLKIPARENIYLAGDFNAHIGCDFNSWSTVIGKHGIGSINENGQRLLKLCATYSLCICNTFFAGS